MRGVGGVEYREYFTLILIVRERDWLGQLKYTLEDLLINFNYNLIQNQDYCTTKVDETNINRKIRCQLFLPESLKVIYSNTETATTAFF